eukprot:1198610-Pyramimonas_sp.AAC.1
MHHQPHLGGSSMRHRASKAAEYVCNHLGCLSVSVGAGKFRMLSKTELFDVFVLVHSSPVVLIL